MQILIYITMLFIVSTQTGFAQEQEKVIPTVISCPVSDPVKEKVADGNSSYPKDFSGKKDADKKQETEVYTVVQEMPQFPGGAGEMMKFIQKNLHYPEIEKEAGITGKCYVKFIVEPDGSISNVQVLKGIAKGANCDKEAVRVIESMPKWSAGKQNGNPVRVYFNLPISFRLNEIKDPKRTGKLLFKDCPPTIKQGLYGCCTYKTGDCMPIIDTNKCKWYGVKRTIFVYEATTESQTNNVAQMNTNWYSQIKTKLIAKTQSDENGCYQVELPVGKYSVLILENNKYYCGSWGDNGLLCPVTINANEVTKKNLLIKMYVD